MIRTLLTPDQQSISINLPKSFVGKQVEVIAFTIFESNANVLVCPINCETKFEQPIQKLFEEYMPEEEDIYR